MSDPHDMPAELIELEREFAAATAADGPPTPPAALRPRVLRAVREELRGQQSRRLWWWAAGAAAAVLAWANLSLTLTAGGGAGVGPWPTDPTETKQLAAELRRELPELTEREAMIQAVELHAAARLVPRPAVAGRFSAPGGAENIRSR